MKKPFNPFNAFISEPPKAKAITQLLDAFSESYKPVHDEELADELFTVRRIREYFNAWPVPKMPDPLPPYLEELKTRGFYMQTAYDGSPCIFCIRSRASGEPIYAEELKDEDDIRTGASSLKELIPHHMAGWKSEKGEGEECLEYKTEDEDDESENYDEYE